MPPATAQLEEHRSSLTGHCYRMMGSAVDAEDAVQETMVRAWRGLERFDGRSSLRTWLHRIATNVCLDLLAKAARRARPFEEGAQGNPHDELAQLPRTHWLEPVPDARVLPEAADPAERLMLRQSIRLAFVAALQHLPPRQRAALLLTEVLGWSASETAETLELTVAAVNSALQRARATLATRDLATRDLATRDLATRDLATRDLARASEPDPQHAALVDRYVEAFLRYDVEELSSMLRDATLSMPPYTLWLRGRDDIRTWLAGPGIGCRGSRLVPVAANGSPAFGQYRVDPGGGFSAWALIVLELADGRIRAMNSFLDTATLFPRFALPLRLPA